jgi:hypothetical protein
MRGCSTLQVCWRQLSDNQKHEVVNELSSYIKQLRALEPREKHKVSSTAGGPRRGVRVGSVKLFGPFDDSPAFHQCVRDGMPLDAARDTSGEKVTRVHEHNYEARFTHGDLGVQNILIRDGKIAAIIDGECVGWYPEYREYTKAQYNRVILVQFCQMLHEQVDRYDTELEADRILWERFGQPLDM